MGTWNSRGLRGSTLEDLVNRANEQYRQMHLGLIQKIPTPITPIRIDKATRHITLAYFDQKSTVDYIGVVQSYPVCFDAKECHPTGTRTIICPAGPCVRSGIVLQREAENILNTRNWIRSISFRKTSGFWFLTWKESNWIW